MALQRLSAVDAVPGLLLDFTALLVMLLVPYLDPTRIVVDRTRYYSLVAGVTLVVGTATAVLFVRCIGSRRPLMVLLTILSLPMLPVGVAPMVNWLNARFDRSPERTIPVMVSGYLHHGRTGLIAVRFRPADGSFGEVEVSKFDELYPDPVPDQGAVYRARLRAGAFGIRWIGALMHPAFGSHRKD